MRSLIFLAEVDIICGKTGPSRMCSLQLKSTSYDVIYFFLLSTLCMGDDRDSVGNQVTHGCLVTFKFIHVMQWLEIPQSLSALACVTMAILWEIWFVRDVFLQQKSDQWEAGWVRAYIPSDVWKPSAPRRRTIHRFLLGASSDLKWNRTLLLEKNVKTW